MTDSEPRREINRRQFFLQIAGALATVAVCRSCQFVTHEVYPPGEVDADELPPETDVYALLKDAKPSQAYDQLIEPRTYKKLAQEIDQVPDLETAEKIGSRILRPIGSHMTFGHTEHKPDWLEYAETNLNRLGYGIPPGTDLSASYESPDTSSAQAALHQLVRSIGVMPTALFATLGIREVAIAKSVTVSLDGPLGTIDKTITDTIDLKHGDILICTEGVQAGIVRKGIGAAIRRQLCFAIDARMSGTADTFNDLEFACAVNSTLDTEAKLIEPTNYSQALKDISSVKADLIELILKEGVVMPEDPRFKLVEAPQTLILRRLLKTFPTVPPSFFLHAA